MPGCGGTAPRRSRAGRHREVPLRAPRRFYRRPRARPSVTAGRVTEQNAPGSAHVRRNGGGSRRGGHVWGSRQGRRRGRGAGGARGTAATGMARGSGDGAITRRRKEPGPHRRCASSRSAPDAPPPPTAPLWFRPAAIAGDGGRAEARAALSTEAGIGAHWTAGEIDPTAPGLGASPQILCVAPGDSLFPWARDPPPPPLITAGAAVCIHSRALSRPARGEEGMKRLRAMPQRSGANSGNCSERKHESIGKGKAAKEMRAALNERSSAQRNGNPN